MRQSKLMLFFILVCACPGLAQESTSPKLSPNEQKSAKWNNYFQGEWTRKSTTVHDGKTTETTTKWNGLGVWKPMLAATAVGGNVLGGEYTSMMSWNVHRNSLYEVGKTSLGDNWEIDFKFVDDKTLRGPASCSLADGQTGKGQCTINRLSKDAYNAYFEAKLDDGSTFRVTDVNTRCSPQGVTLDDFGSPGTFSGDCKLFSDFAGFPAGKKVTLELEDKRILDGTVMAITLRASADGSKRDGSRELHRFNEALGTVEGVGISREGLFEIVWRREGKSLVGLWSWGELKGESEIVRIDNDTQTWQIKNVTSPNGPLPDSEVVKLRRQ